MGLRKRPRRVRGRLMPLANAEAVAALARDAIEQRFGGVMATAARDTGLSRSWLRRLVGVADSRPHGIHPNSLPGLRALVGEAGTAALQEALVPSAIAQMVARHDAWLAQMQAASARGSGVWCEVKGERLVKRRMVPDENGLTQRERERTALKKHIARKHPRLNLRIKRLVATTYMQGRAFLVLARILDLLIEAPESGMIEPSWRDLTFTQLERVLTLGIQREELLISSLERDQQAVRVLAGDSKFRRLWFRHQGRKRKYRKQSGRTDWSAMVTSEIVL